jgi:polyadenylate-binding protein 2
MSNANDDDDDEAALYDEEDNNIETAQNNTTTYENGDEDEEEVEDTPEIAEMKALLEQMEKASNEVTTPHSSSKNNSHKSPPNSTNSSSGNNNPAVAGATSTIGTSPSQESIDQKSIFVGNLDESTVPDDLLQHFQACGAIEKITILMDKHTNKPKGYAYVQFVDDKSVELALGFNETVMKGKALSVVPKRKNVPRFMMRGSSSSSAVRGGRGGYQGNNFRGGRGGGGYRGGGYRGSSSSFRGGGRGGGTRFEPY